MLSTSERRALLDVARSAVQGAVRGGIGKLPDNLPLALLKPAGAFVTLRIQGDLRGCIGYIESHDPLAETVQLAAAKAAVSDFRFERLESSELPDIEIEISVLSPLEKITDVSSIEVGTHGLIIEMGNRRGLLLPQVATEYGWNREEFLNHTAQKAGLPASAWKNPGTVIWSFTAEVFDDEHAHSGRPA